MTTRKRRHLARLPDIARWVETRDLLWCNTSTLVEDPNDQGFVVWHQRYELASVVGTVHPTTIRRAADVCPTVLAFPENVHLVRDVLSGFEAEAAHILVAPTGLLPSPTHACRVLHAPDFAALSDLPATLRAELADVAADETAVVAALDGAHPVAFAYAASETETLWDVSIDTIQSHRRLGYAASAVATLMGMMSAQGKTAVWGSTHSNRASLRLALKLGFVEVDELWVFTRR